MSDPYQAVYEAVRSRFAGCDPERAIKEVLYQSFGMADERLIGVAQVFCQAADEQRRPSVLYRPRLSIDGNQWCALYGDNLQDGVAGFGDSPELAMADFDSQWSSKLKQVESKPLDQMMGRESWPSFVSGSKP
jgi:hypothetical protein